jgi:hypothetical protein
MKKVKTVYRIHKLVVIEETAALNVSSKSLGFPNTNKHQY